VHRVFHLALLFAAGCTGGISSQGSIKTGGSTVGLAFAQLVNGSTPDLAAISSNRGVVEVYTFDKGAWAEVGAFFAGGRAVEIITGKEKGGGVVAVRWDVGTVAILPADPDFPHRLGDPFQVYRRIRNGVPVDSPAQPPAGGYALGDLDGDGSDELLVGAGSLGLFVVPGGGINLALAGNPEKPPQINGNSYPAGPQPGAVAAVDLDGDQKLDVVLLDQREAVARIYKNGGGAANLKSATKVTLPAPGAKVVVTGCAENPVAILLADGGLVTLSRDGKVETVAADLKPIKAIASTRSSVAMTWGPDGSLALFDACTTDGAGVFPNIPTGNVANLAVSAFGDGDRQEMALLDADGKTVSVYQISGF
jgi:hypothetical protein